MNKPSIDQAWMKFYSDVDVKIPKMSALFYLYECNKDNLDSYALNYFNVRVTYNQLFKRIDDVQKSLRSLGVKEHDVVTICMPNTPEAVYTLYAVNSLGAIANLATPLDSLRDIKESINETNAKFLITFDNRLYDMINIVNTTSIEKVILASPLATLPIGTLLDKFGDDKELHKRKQRLVRKDDRFLDWKDFIKKGQGLTVKNVKDNGSSVAAIAHTGGTSGKSKGAKLTNNNLNVQVLRHKLAVLNFERGDTYFNMIPLELAFGLSSLHVSLCLGLENILIPKVDFDNFPDLVLQSKPNHIPATPLHFENLMKRLEKSSELEKQIKNIDTTLDYLDSFATGDKRQQKNINKLKTELYASRAKLMSVAEYENEYTNLTCLKNYFSGGDKADVNLEKAINDIYLKHGSKSTLLKPYGMTETCGAITFGKEGANPLESVGIPLPLITIGIFEPDTDNELDYDMQGEICISGPIIFDGYLNNEEETNKVLRTHSDGQVWLHSGDLGRINQDGVLYHEGRIKRMIIRANGLNIYPQNLEKLFSGHHAVDRCSVVGAPERHYSTGQEPIVYVVLKDGYKNQKEKVIAELKELSEQLIEFARPDMIEFINELPMTKSSKVDYRALEEQAKIKVLGEK